MSTTDSDIAKRSAHQMWATMELLQRVGIPAEHQKPALGATVGDNGKLDPTRPYLALQITTQRPVLDAELKVVGVERVPPFSINCGALTVPHKLFEQVWAEWINSIRGAKSETDVEKKNREELCLQLFFASDAWNERLGLYDYLEQMGCKITRHDETSVRG